MYILFIQEYAFARVYLCVYSLYIIYSFVIRGYATRLLLLLLLLLLPLSLIFFFFFTFLLLKIIIRAGVRVVDERITLALARMCVCTMRTAMMCQSFLVYFFLSQQNARFKFKL